MVDQRLDVLLKNTNETGSLSHPLLPFSPYLIHDPLINHIRQAYTSDKVKEFDAGRVYEVVLVAGCQ